MNKINLTALLILTGISVNSFAQNKYLKGFIVKGTDTVNCYIKKESLKTLQNHIIVKKTTEDSEETDYFPDDLKGFYTENFGWFTSKEITVRIVTDIMKSQDFWAEENPEFIDKKIFLSRIVSGKTNLYLFIDDNSNTHYFIEKDTTIYELYKKYRFKHYIEKNVQKRKLTVQKNYLGKLSYMFSDCPQIKSNLNNSKFSGKNLIRMTNEYNNFVSSSNYQLEKYKKIILEKSVSAGISYNNFFFWGENHNIFVNNIKPYNKTFTGGISLNIIFPRINYNLSLFSGLYYTNNNFKAQYDTTISDISYSYKVNLNTYFLRIPLLLRYTFIKKDFKPYIFTGIFVAPILKHSNELITEKNSIFHNKTDTTYVFRSWDASSSTYQSRLLKAEIGLTFGIGSEIKIYKNTSFIFESRFERGGGISDILGFGVSSNYISLMIGIKF